MNVAIKDFILKFRNDIIVVIIIIFTVFLTFLIPYILNKNAEGEAVVILQDGKEVYRYELFQDRTITVKEEDQGYNLILINDGMVSVTDADCPDKLCIKQKSISKGGESIICLPHKLVIVIESSEESDLDAVTN